LGLILAVLAVFLKGILLFYIFYVIMINMKNYERFRSVLPVAAATVIGGNALSACSANPPEAPEVPALPNCVETVVTYAEPTIIAAVNSALTWDLNRIHDLNGDKEPIDDNIQQTLDAAAANIYYGVNISKELPRPAHVYEGQVYSVYFNPADPTNVEVKQSGDDICDHAPTI
jgi:hypothetical protein